jgi:uroporphyrinogen-III synthase
VREVRSYGWRLPVDVSPIERLIDELIAGRIDAVAFTSQVQVHHLLEVGARMQRRDALLDALRHRTVVGSIGPTCSRALTESGAPPHVTASPPRMRPLVSAIGEHLAHRQVQTAGQNAWSVQ